MIIEQFIKRLHELNFSLQVKDGKIILQKTSSNVTPEQIESIKRNNEVTDFIKDHKQEIISYLSNKPVNPKLKSVYRLTGLQEGLLYHALVDKSSISYIGQCSCELNGVNQRAFEQSWNYLLCKHTILRTAIDYEELSVPVQYAYENVNLPLEYFNFTDLAPALQQAKITDYQIQTRANGFDLKQAPIMKVALMKLNHTEFVMVWTYHHIIIDGWSLPILIKEFLEVYDEYAKDKFVPLPSEDRFEDYVHFINNIDPFEQESFWKKYLSGISGFSGLPMIGATVEERGKNEFSSLQLTVHPTLKAQAQYLIHQNHLTLNTLFQGVWSILLHHYLQNDHICFGITVSGRPEELPDIEERVGIYINTIPFHSVYNQDQTLLDWLATMQHDQIEARQYQYTALNIIKKSAQITGELFDTLLVFENYPAGSHLRNKSIQFKNFRFRQQTNYPLTLLVRNADSLVVDFQYDNSLLSRHSVAMIVRHFEYVLTQVVQYPTSQLRDIQLLTPEETRQFSHDRSDVGYPKSENIISLFEEQVERYPDSVAVSFENQSLTYRQLNSKVNQLANYLRSELKIGADDLIAICAERSESLIIAILGALKSGAGYVPIDPFSPKNRIRFIIEDCCPKALLTDRMLDNLPGVLCIPICDGIIWQNQSQENPKAIIAPEQIAYIIYTSGTTGFPKGVIISHRNVVRLLFNDENLFDFSSNDVWTLFHAFNFDFSVWEIFGALLNGGKLVIVPKETAIDTFAFWELLKSECVTILNQTPSAFYNLSDLALSDGLHNTSLRKVIFGGEALTVPRLKPWHEKFPHVQLINMYGITETTVHVSYKLISSAEINSPTSNIGIPIPTLSLFILDHHLGMVPPGIAGDLYIAGEGLARGYLNNPELTKQRFIDNPFRQGTKMYQTGDIGRLLEGGDIEFIGRRDHQIKIRGFRIEPAEIETALRKREYISDAIVLALRDGSKENQLVAFTVLKNRSASWLQLADDLKQDLAEYMIPAHFVEIGMVPLTTNGKVDRSKLVDLHHKAVPQEKLTEPQTSTEKRMVQIWMTVLGSKSISVDSNFFSLGGDSIKAIRLVGAIKRNIGNVEVKTLFSHPTIALLSKVMDGNTSAMRDEISQAAVEVELSVEREVSGLTKRPERMEAAFPMSDIQKGMVFHNSISSAQAIYHDQFFYSVEDPTFDFSIFTSSFGMLVAKHPILRTSFLMETSPALQIVHFPHEEENRISFEDISYLTDNDQRVYLEKCMRQDRQEPFDVSLPGLWRLKVCKVSTSKYGIMWIHHHAIMDGWSNASLMTEWSQIYFKKKNDRTLTIAPLAVTYKDYVIDQYRVIRSVQHRDFWQKQLENYVRTPLPFLKTAHSNFEGTNTVRSFPINQSPQIVALAQTLRVQVRDIFLTAFLYLMKFLCDTSDVTIGLVTHGRPELEDADKVIGCFLNSIPFRMKVPDTIMAHSLLSQVAQQAMLLKSFDKYPLGEMVRSLLKGESSNKFFDVLFNYVDFHVYQDIHVETKIVESIIQNRVATNTLFDFDVNASGYYAISYDTRLYTDEEITRFSTYYNRVLNIILHNDQLATEMVLGETEKLRLFEWGTPTVPFEHDNQCVMDWFELQVEKSPNCPAVIVGSEMLTYKELDQYANQLAHLLLERGINKETPVPVFHERNLNIVIALLGIMKAGGAYVPMDAEYHTDRFNYIMDDLDAHLLIISSMTRTLIRDTERKESVVVLDEKRTILSPYPTSRPPVRHSSTDLAYLIYTSGSTGQPKGVAVQHDNLLYITRNWRRHYRLDESSLTFLSFASISFDVFTGDVCRSLTTGGTLVLLPEGKAADVEFIGRLLKEKKVNIFETTPVVLLPIVKYLQSVEEMLPHLKLVIVGSDQINRSDFNFLNGYFEKMGIRFINSYGLTETTIDSSYHEGEVSGAIAPIGRPFPNTHYFIADKHKNLSAYGMPGELLIGGDGVSRGYLNQPELTHDKFIPDQRDTTKKLFRTGDLCQWSENGNVEYLGRTDNQVKIRGYRIELGEIENILRERASQVVVLVAPGNSYYDANLVAFVVEQDFDRESLRSFAFQRLPAYMVPAYWLPVKQVPLTMNGKVDKQSLLALLKNFSHTETYVAPTDELGKLLAEIWKEILGVAKIGARSNFFMLGGHSLRAMQLVSRIREQFNTEIKLRDVFESPDLEHMATLVRNRTSFLSSPIPQLDKKFGYPLSPAQQRLWILSQFEESSLAYNMNSMLKLRGKLDFPCLVEATGFILKRHESLRTVFKEDGQAMVYQHIMDTIDVGRYLTTTIMPAGKSFNDIYNEEQLVPFNLSEGPLFRIKVIELDTENWLLFFSVHHIISDGWSMDLLAKEITQCYNAFVSGQPVEMPPLTLQYKDYASWINSDLAGESVLKDEQYWLEMFTDSPLPVLELPHAKMRPKVQSYRGTNLSKPISGSTLQNFIKICEDNGCTLFTGVTALVNTLFFKYTDAVDIILGTPVSGRSRKELENQVGLFLNTIAVRTRFNASDTFKQLLENQKKIIIESLSHQTYPFERLVKKLNLSRDLSRSALFDVLLVFQNHGTLGAQNLPVEFDGLTSEFIPDLSLQTSQFDIKLTFVESPDKMEIVINYNSDIYNDSIIRQMIQHLESLMKSVAKEFDRPIHLLNLLSSQEFQLLNFDFNSAKADYPLSTLVTLFEEQVLKKGDTVALTVGDKQLTYSQINEYSNRLTHLLQTTYQLKPNETVGLLMDRSEWMLISLWGILKSGAAYVPVDPTHPAERARFMITNAQCRLLITDHEFHAFQELPVLILPRDQFLLEDYSPKNPFNRPHSGDLVYVIYTSGSTGNPKGVKIHHQGIVNRISWMWQEYSFDETDIILQKTPYVFDVSVWELFMPLCFGAQLVLCSREVGTDPWMLLDIIQRHTITALHFVPSMFNAFVQVLTEQNIQRLKSLRNIFCSGEALQPSTVDRFYRKVSVPVHNLYGPTEASVDVTHYTVKLGDEIIPIGAPISNMEVFIVDDFRNMVPLWATGEIYLSGIGLASGYIQNAELTESAFVDHPFRKGEKAYRTGDLGRWLPDGNVEFLGRRDHQVKIHGYRIELLEIENALLGIDGIREAVVRLTGKNAQLVAYLVTYQLADSLIKNKLAEVLPDYMIPSAFVQLDKIPLNTNGKVDNKALPQPLVTEEQENRIEPASELESELLIIWKEILGNTNIGRSNNFFELGGDSINGIQVVGRIKKLGLNASAKDIFNFPTISALAQAIQSRQVAPVVEENVFLTGDFGLLPIQQRFFENTKSFCSHFNQSVLLDVNKSMNAQNILKAFVELVNRHDALRFSYHHDGTYWKQQYGDHFCPPEIVDLSEVPNWNSSLDKISNDCQRRLEIEKGVLVRVVLFVTPPGVESNKLLIIIHHLAVDGVSWRILLSDLNSLLDALNKNETLGLVAKSSSYRQWYDRLKSFGSSATLNVQLAYWRKCSQKSKALVTESPGSNSNLIGDIEFVSSTLSEELTSKLLYDSSRAYLTEINDLLLAALTKTICEWTGSDSLCLGLEGHGREELFEEIDISRTVGWFTTIYPVLLESKPADSLGMRIRKTKEYLRLVPNKGLGYGVLKYINREPDLQGADPWEIVFNYLGQVDSVFNLSKWFKKAGESSGGNIDYQLNVHEKISVEAVVYDRRLVINWNYNKKLFLPLTIQNIAGDFIENLKSIISLCAKPSVQQYVTPSDFGLGGQVNITELDRFLDQPYGNGVRREAMERMYRLTGLQEGMIFHSTFDDHLSTYINQVCCDFTGLDLVMFASVWQHMIQKHTILRSRFHLDDFDIPVQAVYKDRTLPIDRIEHPSLPIDDLQTQIVTKFDFKTLPFNITLVRKDAAKYRMIFTFHHALLDGWSVSNLITEFLENYSARGKGVILSDENTDTFEEYVRFIEQRDWEKERSFWIQYFDGVEEGTLIPFGEQVDRNNGLGSYQSLNLHFSEVQTETANRYVKANKVTLNTLVQAIWSQLLHYYTGKDHVLFGVTMSGRPEQLHSFEKRVGMFINTIPFLSVFTAEQKVSDLLSDIQSRLVTLTNHQYAPLSEIKQWSGINAELFDTLLVFENYPVGKISNDTKRDIRIDQIEVVDHTNYPLSILVSPSHNLTFSFSYNQRILSDEEVLGIRNDFEYLFLQMVTAEVDSVGDFNFILPHERQKIMLDYNDTVKHYPIRTTIELFEDQVQRTPNHIALTFGAEEITYKELDNRANQVASVLLDKGLRPRAPVMVYMEKNVELIVGVLGILKTGNPYLPVDSSYPPERIGYVISDSGAQFILVNDRTLMKELPPIEVLNIQTDVQDADNAPVKFNLTEERLAYLIYTSGTTGFPKGIQMPDSALVNLLFWHQEQIQTERPPRVLQFASIAFDASYQEIFSALCFGGSVHVIDEYTRRDMGMILDAIISLRINHMFVPFIVLKNLAACARDLNKWPTNLTKIFTAGEQLHLTEEIRVFKKNTGVSLLNYYGPSETHVVTSYQVKEQDYIDTPLPPIGKPIANSTIYILNTRGQMCRTGVFGEIYIGGCQVADGYINKPELTSNRFLVDRFASRQAALMYRTGDIGRWRTDGNIEFMGRVDDQVKIRGYRVEIAEIETTLHQCELVRQAVVMIHTVHGSNTLKAYVVGEGKFDKSGIIDFLRSKLPDYMIPSIIISVQGIPLTVNGKVDKRLLQKNEGESGPGLGEPGVQSETEGRLLAIWQEYLSVRQISINDHFFELGGHSLLASRVAANIFREFNVKVSLRLFFQLPTIATMARYIDVECANNAQHEKTNQDYYDFTL